MIIVFLASFGQSWTADRVLVSAVESLLMDTNQKAAENLSKQFQSYVQHLDQSLQAIAENKSALTLQNDLDLANVMVPEINTLIVINEEGIVKMVFVR